MTFNYNLVSVGEKKLKCLCNAPSCSGFIGERTVKVNEEIYIYSYFIVYD